MSLKSKATRGHKVGWIEKSGVGLGGGGCGYDQNIFHMILKGLIK